MEAAGLAPNVMSLDNLPDIPKDIRIIRSRANKCRGHKMFDVADELKDTCKPGEMSVQYGNRVHECAMGFREKAGIPQFDKRHSGQWDQAINDWQCGH